jgi:hypothetical protein
MTLAEVLGALLSHVEEGSGASSVGSDAVCALGLPLEMGQVGLEPTTYGL